MSLGHVCRFRHASLFDIKASGCRKSTSHMGGEIRANRCASGRQTLRNLDMATHRIEGGGEIKHEGNWLGFGIPFTLIFKFQYMIGYWVCWWQLTSEIYLYITVYIVICTYIYTCLDLVTSRWKVGSLSPISELLEAITVARQATERGVSAKEVGLQAGNLCSLQWSKRMVKLWWSHPGAGWLDWDIWIIVESGNLRFPTASIIFQASKAAGRYLGLGGWWGDLLPDKCVSW